MRCPSCQGPMLLLFTSAICENCENRKASGEILLHVLLHPLEIRRVKEGVAQIGLGYSTHEESEAALRKISSSNAPYVRIFVKSDKPLPESGIYVCVTQQKGGDAGILGSYHLGWVE